MNAPKLLTIVLLLISICSGCNTNGNDDPNVVAEYGEGRKIKFEELNKYVNDWNYNKRFRDDKIEAYTNALNDMVKNQMKRVDFFERELDTNKVLIQSISRIINEELVGLYFEKQYLSKYTADEFARTVYNSMDKRVVYQEIILKKPVDAAQSKLSEIENKALDIKTEIENGADFNKMIQKYSEDIQSVQNKGYASPVAWKQSVLDPVGNVIFNLNKGDIRAISTDKDYKIIKVAEVTKIKLGPFEEIKDKVIEDIKEVYNQKALDEFVRDKDASIDTTNAVWNEPTLRELVKWSDIPNSYTNPYEETLAKAMSKSDNKIILTYKNGKVDYKEYLRLARNVLTIKTDAKMNEKDIKNFIIDAVTTDKMIRKADSLDLRKEVFNAYTKNPVIKDRLVYLYNQAEIEQKIPPLTEENLYSFFKDNEETIFYQLEKRNIYAMVFENEEDAKKVYDKIKSGAEFEKVTGRFFVKTYIKERGGELRAFMGSEKPVFAGKAFEMKLNEVSEPVQFVDEDGLAKYAVLKCKNIRPEKQLTYDEAKGILDDEFKNFYRKKIESEIEKRLAQRYNPKYYYDVLPKMISSN